MSQEQSESEGLYVITRTHTGFMSSDREEAVKVFGPASKSACQQRLRDLTAYDGPGSNSGYAVVPVRRTVTDRW